MIKKSPISIFWFRRDLRLDDNAGLYRALKGDHPVLCLFIFDKSILDKLEDKDDARVTFIYQAIEDLHAELQKHGSTLLVLYDEPEQAWKKVLKDYDIAAVYTNHDYEPYGKQRDEKIGKILKEKGIPLNTYKDQVIFDKKEVTKDDGLPYTVYTPYMRKWYTKLKPFYLKPYPVSKYLDNLHKTHQAPLPTLKEMGFIKSERKFPDKNYEDVIDDYHEKRDFPAIKGTSHIGLHLRFGTVSIRELARKCTWI
jgi:deoxyribodipyrimidine photo-lyase